MKAKGPILLLITAILWGFAFVAQTTASSDIGPFTFNASRNIIGAVFLTGVIAMRKRLVHDQAPQQGSDSNASGYTRKALVIAGVACGVVLFFASYLQQAGITAYPDGAAASSRSGFVTATYMIMVALMGVVVGKKTQPIVFVAVAVSMLGMYLLVRARRPWQHLPGRLARAGKRVRLRAPHHRDRPLHQRRRCEAVAYTAH